MFKTLCRNMSSWIRWPVDKNPIMYLCANHLTSLNVSSQDKNSSIYCILLSWEVNEIIYVKCSGLCLEHKNLIHVRVTVIIAAAAIIIIIIIIASSLHMNLQVVNLCLSSFWCSGFPFDLSFRMDLRKLMILNFFRFLIVVRVVWWLLSSLHARPQTRSP